MKTFYSLLQGRGILCVLLISAFSGEALSQVSICSNTFTACVGTQETFTGGANGFSSPAGFVYSSNALRVASTTNNTNYTILSRAFTLTAANTITVGFTTATSTATIASYNLEILRASDNLVLASCSGPTAPPAITAGPICYTISDPDIAAGVDVIYRITIRTGGGSNAETLVFDNFTYLQVQQAPLPVSFSSFTATRNDTRVLLKWQTASESNNQLFEVQRKTTKNDFETIASIPSKAANGNSSSLLSYEFDDQNNFKGSSYYRIRQVDKDGKSTYSQIRIITNKTGDKVLIYPNPSKNGMVSVTFNSNEPKKIDLVDNTGRTVQQWKSFTDQDLKISKLSTGIYLLKTKNLQTNEQSVHRIVVTQ